MIGKKICDEAWVVCMMLIAPMAIAGDSTYASTSSMWTAGAVVVAAFAAIVSIRQYFVARDRLRLDLFDKRFRVFEASRNVIAEHIQGPTPDSNRLLRYSWEIVEARFLFGPEVVEYLDNLFSSLMKFQAVTAVMRASNTTPERMVEAIESQKKLFEWITHQQRTSLMAVMNPYLHFGDIRRRK